MRTRIKTTKADIEREIRREVLAPDPRTPMPGQAEELVLILQAGVDPKRALAYFFGSIEEVEIAYANWLGHRVVQEAFARLNKGEWQHLSADERIELALKKHYAEMAFYLWTHHYAEIWGKELEKANVCRTALEAKLAGTSGTSPLERFWSDYVAQSKEGSNARSKARSQEGETAAKIAEIMAGPSDPQ